MAGSLTAGELVRLATVGVALVVDLAAARQAGRALRLERSRGSLRYWPEALELPIPQVLDA